MRIQYTSPTRSPRPIGRSFVDLSRSLALTGLILAGLGLAAAPPLSTEDAKFILSAAQGGMTEVKLGELAVGIGARDDVKALGRRMAKDHEAINSDLKALANQKGVSLPDAMDEKHLEIVERMAGLDASKFDQAYITHMIKAHKKDAKAFNSERSSTSDADIKLFLEKVIPIVEGHLKQARALQR